MKSSKLYTYAMMEKKIQRMRTTLDNVAAERGYVKLNNLQLEIRGEINRVKKRKLICVATPSIYKYKAMQKKLEDLELEALALARLIRSARGYDGTLPF